MIFGSVCLGVLLDFYAMLGASGYLLSEARPAWSCIYLQNALRQLLRRRMFTEQWAALYYTMQYRQLKA